MGMLNDLNMYRERERVSECESEHEREDVKMKLRMIENDRECLCNFDRNQFRKRWKHEATNRTRLSRHVTVEKR